MVMFIGGLKKCFAPKESEMTRDDIVNKADDNFIIDIFEDL